MEDIKHKFYTETNALIKQYRDRGELEAAQAVTNCRSIFYHSVKFSLLNSSLQVEEFDKKGFEQWKLDNITKLDNRYFYRESGKGYKFKYLSRLYTEMMKAKP